MSWKMKPLNSTQLAALRDAAANQTGRLAGDRCVLKALRDRGFAVELDVDGRHVFTLHPISALDYVAGRITADSVHCELPGRSGGFFITPLGKDRAKFAADVKAERDGVRFDSTLMEDL